MSYDGDNLNISSLIFRQANNIIQNYINNYYTYTHTVYIIPISMIIDHRIIAGAVFMNGNVSKLRSPATQLGEWGLGFGDAYGTVR